MKRGEMDSNSLTYRDRPVDADMEMVRHMVTESGFFYPEEVEVAVELIKERLLKGLSSGYHFHFAEKDGRVMGYACFGPIPCTKESYDLYWIVVQKDFRGKGIGKGLLKRTQRTVKKMGGRRIYVETSSRKIYEPTRLFYLQCGYEEEAVLSDFYSPGDDKVIFMKRLSG
jgi:GNAT superfamily N-acetyltransferase